jgi:hypothetical protein
MQIEFLEFPRAHRLLLIETFRKWLALSQAA